MYKRALFYLKFRAFAIFLTVIFITILSGCVKNTTVNVANIGLNTDTIRGTLLIRSQDNLWNISKRFKLPIRDIINANSISPPYRLKTGDRIKLPKPKEYIVRENDSIYSISRLFNIGVGDLIRINDMRPPYKIYTGQRLKLPNYSTTKNIAPSKYSKKYSNNSYNPKTKSYKITRPAGKKAVAIEKNTSYKNYKSKNVPQSYKYIWPVRGKIISSFGPKTDGLQNDGVNIAAPKGTPVKSVLSGKVVYVGNELSSFGNLVLIKHDNGIISAYGHLDNTKIAKGDIVKQGDIIGTVGSSGNVSTPQLHFELRRGSQAINPQNYLI